MVIPSMAFPNSTVSFVDVSTLVDVPATRIAIASGTIGGNEVANVEGIVVDTVGMTV